jgi:hypothetical protein
VQGDRHTSSSVLIAWRRAARLASAVQLKLWSAKASRTMLTANGTALWERNPTRDLSSGEERGSNIGETLGRKRILVNGPEVHSHCGHAAAELEPDLHVAYDIFDDPYESGGKLSG